MRLKYFAVGAVALLVVGAVALAQSNVSITPGLHWFTDGVFFGPRSINPAAQRRNALAATYESALVSWDFAALATGVCADGPAVTLTGAALGDACFLGVDTALGADAPNLVMGCRVTATNAGTFRACAVGTSADGGSTDLPDSGYTLRSFR